MNHLLIYLPLANVHRAPIMQQMAERYIANGYNVSILVESQLCIFRNKRFEGYSKHKHTIAKYIDFSIYKNVFYLKLPHVKVAEWPNIENNRLEYYKQVLKTGGFTKVLVWNGNFDYQQTFLKLIRKKQKISLLYTEVAWFDQSNSVYVDPLGVNGNSLLAQTAPKKLTNSQEIKVKQFIQDYTGGLSPSKLPNNKLIKILVPLQVDTDSNIVHHSPFKNMKSFIAYLENWLPDKNIEVLIRAHPKATYEYEIKSNRNDFRIDSTGELKSKIAEADIVIGINSTVLLQSLAFLKPVFAFGDGVFSSSSAVHKIRMDEPFSIPSMDVCSIYELLHFLVFQKQIPISNSHGNNVAKYCIQRIRMLAM
ncbi:capsular polysaccharide export protein, LipB/KpsS family [Thalassotalea fusca]